MTIRDAREAARLGAAVLSKRLPSECPGIGGTNLWVSVAVKILISVYVGPLANVDDACLPHIVGCGINRRAPAYVKSESSAEPVLRDQK